MSQAVALRRRGRLIGLLLPVTLFLALFFIGPLLIMAIYAFLEPGLYGGVVWSYYDQNFGRILGWADGIIEEFDPVYLEVFLHSVRLALMTVFFCLIICYPAAFWVGRLSDRARNFVVFLITLPFFISLIVRLFAWLLILRPTGFLNTMLLTLGVVSEPLDLIFSEFAVILGMVYVMIPFMFLPLFASIEKLDNRLIEASADLGANHLETFRRVILPLTLPGIIGGSIIVFIPSLGNFVVPDLLGGAKVVMIGNLIEQQFLYARNWPFGAALAMVVMSLILVFLMVYVRVVSRDQAAAQ
jgi:spermidine/putrescine transport system permease protein